MVSKTHLQNPKASDSSLLLRALFDQGVHLEKKDALTYLSNSKIVQTLTEKIIDDPLFYIWRIIALSEIPYAINLNYTANLIDRIYDQLSTEYGFSLSGDQRMFLPCYNAMTVSALSRLGRSQDEEVKKGVNWIVSYQPMANGIQVSAPGLTFDRYGGCFKNTPCYIGLAKSVMALIEYQNFSQDVLVKEKIETGIEYILAHKLFKRLTTGAPITPRILDISFPESYHLNIVDLVRMVKKSNHMTDNRTKYAVSYLLGMQQPDGGWKVTYRFKGKGYISFDTGSKTGDWVSYIIKKSINLS